MLGNTQVQAVIGIPAITLAEAKKQLGLSTTADDGLISNFILAAQARAELLTGRVLSAATYISQFNLLPTGYFIIIPKAPVIAVTAVKYTDLNGDIQTLDSSYYEVDLLGEPSLIYFNDISFISSMRTFPRALLQVEYTAGYSDISYSADTISATGSGIADSANGLGSFFSGSGIVASGFSVEDNNNSFVVNKATSGKIFTADEMVPESSGNTITLKASSVPAAIKQWMLVTVDTLYEQREAFTPSVNSSVGEYLSAVPNRFIDGLLDNYVIPWGTML